MLVSVSVEFNLYRPLFGILHGVKKVTDVHCYFSDSQNVKALANVTKGKMFSAHDYIQVRKLFVFVLLFISNLSTPKYNFPRCKIQGRKYRVVFDLLANKALFTWREENPRR